MSAQEILNSIEKLNFENTFNPYFEKCSAYDAPDAPNLRRAYLSRILEQAAATELDAIWVGRDLGHRGGRRTGLALTDDIHFSDHLTRWGILAERPTFGEPVAERTATVIWSVLRIIEQPIFLWNVFPLHPFNFGDEFSNRAHNAPEREAGTSILIKIIEYLNPRRIIAIGNDAFNVLSTISLNQKIFKARHPSYGGQDEFLTTMKTLYFSNFISEATSISTRHRPQLNFWP